MKQIPSYTREQLIDAMIDVNKNIYRKAKDECDSKYEVRMFVLSRFHIDQLIKFHNKIQAPKFPPGGIVIPENGDCHMSEKVLIKCWTGQMAVDCPCEKCNSNRANMIRLNFP